MNPQFAQMPQQQPAPFSQNATVVLQSSQPQQSGADLSISGMVFAFFMPPLGLALSILGHRKAKRAGERGRLAFVGILISSATTVVAVGGLIVFIATLVTVSQKCSELGSGTHYLDTTTKIQCN